MTFYWWSHWFWITLFSHILVLIALVHTYPSQEISLEPNQNSKTTKVGVTKLFQTSTTSITWATAAPSTTSNGNFGIAADRTVLQSVTPDMASADLDVNGADLSIDEVEENDDPEDVENMEDIELEEEHTGEEPEQGDADAAESEEFKRSLEAYNKTSADTTKEEKPSAADAEVESREAKVEVARVAEVELAKMKREQATEVNNYTNFSSDANVMSTNTIKPNASTIETNKNSAAAPPAAGATANNQSGSEGAVLIPAAAPPNFDKTRAALDILSAMASVTSSSTSTATSNGEDASAPQSQRVPFTLENANKEDELRRAENEHRSRKSKVLSAEYKHINRFINLSTDSKNLLTRSASTAPEYDAEEGNISSEALAIQRTYFLDAGAISAICFTIFGVCCAVGTVGIVLYRRRYLNKPQALSEPDSSVYIDDSTMRDNSDEMYSLDNDSFLNSLEAMTIQNYWTDTVKHTKL